MAGLPPSYLRHSPYLRALYSGWGMAPPEREPETTDIYGRQVPEGASMEQLAALGRELPAGQRQTGFSGVKEAFDFLDIPGAFVRGLIGAGVSAARGEFSNAGKRLLSALPGSENVPLLINTIFGTNIKPIDATFGDEILEDLGMTPGTTTEDERRIRIAMAGGMSRRQAERLFATRSDRRPLSFDRQQEFDDVLARALERNPTLDTGATFGDAKKAVDATDFAGLAFDILTDPLTYFTMGASAAGKTARLVAQAERAGARGLMGSIKGLGREEALSAVRALDVKGFGPKAKERLVKNLDEFYRTGKGSLDDIGTTLAQQSERGQFVGRFSVPFTNVTLVDDFTVPVVPEMLSVLGQSDLARQLATTMAGREAPAGVNDRLYNFMTTGMTGVATGAVRGTIERGRRFFGRTGVADLDRAIKEGAELGRIGAADLDRKLNAIEQGMRDLSRATGIDEATIRRTATEAVEAAKATAGDVPVGVAAENWATMATSMGEVAGRYAATLSRTGLKEADIAPLAAGLATINESLLSSAGKFDLRLNELSDHSLAYLHRMVTPEGREWLKANGKKFRQRSGGLEFDTRSGMFKGRTKKWQGKTIAAINDEMEEALGAGVKFFNEDPIAATRYAINETHRRIGNAYTVARVTEDFGDSMPPDLLEGFVEGVLEFAAGRLDKAQLAVDAARAGQAGFREGRTAVRRAAPIATRQADEAVSAGQRAAEVRGVAAESMEGSQIAYRQGRDAESKAVQVAEALRDEAKGVVAATPGATEARAGMVAARKALASAKTQKEMGKAAQKIARAIGVEATAGDDAVAAAQELVRAVQKHIRDNPDIAEADKILRTANQMLADARQTAARVETFELQRQVDGLLKQAEEAVGMKGIGAKHLPRAQRAEIAKVKKVVDDVANYYRKQQEVAGLKAANAEQAAMGQAADIGPEVAKARKEAAAIKHKSVRDIRAALSTMRSELRKDAPAALLRHFDRVERQALKLEELTTTAQAAVAKPVAQAVRSQVAKRERELRKLQEKLADPEQVVPKDWWVENSALEAYQKVGLRIDTVEDAVRLSQTSLPEEMFQAVTRAAEFQKDPAKFWKGFEAFTNWMKKTVTQVWPMYHGRNLLENHSKAVLEGNTNLDNFKQAAHVVARLLDENAGMHGRIGDAGRAMTRSFKRKFGEVDDATWKLIREEGGFDTWDDFAAWARGTGLTENKLSSEFGFDMTRQLSDGSSMTAQRLRAQTRTGARHAVNGFGAVDAAFQAGSASENWYRVSFFLDRLKKGYGREGALNEVKRVYFDYRDLGRVEALMARRLGFFYNFYRNNARYMTEYAGRHPVLTKQIAKLYIDDPDDARHSWLSDFGSFKVAGYEVSLGFLPQQQFRMFDLAEGDIMDKAGGKFGQAAGVMNPVWQKAAELATRTDLWTNQPLDRMDRAPGVWTFAPQAVQDMIGLRQTTDGSYIMDPKWRWVTNALPVMGRFSQTSIFSEKEDVELWQTMARLMSGIRIEQDDIARGSLNALNRNIDREGDRLDNMRRVGLGAYAPDTRTPEGRIISALMKERPDKDDVETLFAHLPEAQKLGPYVQLDDAGRPVMSEMLRSKIHGLAMELYPRHWALMRIQGLKRKAGQEEIGEFTRGTREAFQQRAEANEFSYKAESKPAPKRRFAWRD
jgi:hypothetical protein